MSIPSPAFAEALAKAGAEYRDTRDALLAGLSTGDRDALAAAAVAPPWRERLTARILLAWAGDRARCEAVAPRMRGDREVLGPPPALTGRWSGTDRGRAVAALRPKAAPRVLEILWKTGEASADVEIEALFHALQAWQDPDTDPVMIDLLRDGPRYVRCLAAQRLGGQGVAEATPGLFAALTDRASDDAVRGAAASALAQIRPPGGDVVEALRVILASARESSALKEQIASALARIDPAAAAAALGQHVLLIGDDALRCALMSDLAAVGDAHSAAVLDRIAGEHPREWVREEAAKAAGTLRARLGGPSP